MTADHATSKTCFVFADAETTNGFVVSMCMPGGKPLKHKLSLKGALELQRQLSEAIAEMSIDLPEKYFQK